MTFRMRSWLFFSSGFLVVVASALPAAAQGQQYIVSFQEGTPRSARAAAVARHGADLRFNYSLIDAVAVTVPNENALRALAGDASVRSITPDHPVFASQSEQASDKAKENGKGGKGPGGGGSTVSPQVLPLGVQRVGPSTVSSTGAGIGVAIMDTGIDLNQADLGLIPVAGRYNAFSGTTDCQDDNGHGTHVAGTVAALDNPRDVVGVAPGATLYCVKVLNAQGNGNWSTVIAGLDWIHINGALMNPAIRVVNMSLGGPGTVDPTSPLQTAIRRIYDAGIVVVVAAGNDPSLDVSLQVPAAYPEVLTVASTTAVAGIPGCSLTVASDTASYFTSDGAGVTISAPGEDQENITKTGRNCYLNSVGILSLKLGGGTTRMSGTSMATPHVSGIVARLLEDPFSYFISAANGTAADVENIRIYFSDPNRGASGRGTAPYDSLAISNPTDSVHEGIAVIHSPE